MRVGYLPLVISSAFVVSCAHPVADVPIAEGSVIDAHYHAGWQSLDAEQRYAERIAEMRANDIAVSTLFITSKGQLDTWLESNPGQFIAGPMVPCPALDTQERFCFDEDDGWVDTDWLEDEIRKGRVRLIGEVLTNYYGIPPADPRLKPYFSLALKYDIPVLAHTNDGPPQGRGPRRHDGCCPDFDGAMGNPDLWRPVLDEYPGLRLVLQHSGFPVAATPEGEARLGETISLMKDYPQVYADMSVLNAIWDEESYRDGVMAFKRAGLLDRVIYGSDNNDPQVTYARLRRMTFLDESERQGILRDNAVRFFRLNSHNR